MAIIQTVTESMFIDEFDAMNRADNFTRPARRELFDYYDELSEDTGEAFELDVIAVCCEWSEYSADELEEQFSHLVDAAERPLLVGTISRGTHRLQDLLPVFLDALQYMDEDAYAALIAPPFGPIPAYAMEDDSSEWWGSEAASDLLTDLFDLLESAAPDGWTFGAHEGDGSDFGYWEDEDAQDERFEELMDALRDNTTLIEVPSAGTYLVEAF